MSRRRGLHKRCAGNDVATVVRFDDDGRQGCAAGVMRLGNVPVLAYPTVIWTRVTWCRKHGHNMRARGEYALDAPLTGETFEPSARFCENCGAPWFTSHGPG